MMSGKGSVKDAVAAVRKGAYDFIEKPLDTDRLLAMLRNLERESAVLRKLDAFREAWLEEHVFMEEGSALDAAFESARKTAASPLSILVTGPTGSGKELAARWIHLCSPRSQGPFIAVNCAAIPQELGESAFFGSRKGSYTGASSDRPGYFEAAAGGTLFLDEVGEIGLGLQAALLRAVETGEIQPVGAREILPSRCAHRRRDESRPERRTRLGPLFGRTCTGGSPRLRWLFRRWASGPPKSAASPNSSPRRSDARMGRGCADARRERPRLPRVQALAGQRARAASLSRTGSVVGAQKRPHRRRLSRGTRL